MENLLDKFIQFVLKVPSGFRYKFSQDFLYSFIY